MAWPQLKSSEATPPTTLSMVNGPPALFAEPGAKGWPLSRITTPSIDDDGSYPADAKAPSSGHIPSIVHRWQQSKSILSLAASDGYIFAGTGGNEIQVFDTETYQQVDTLTGHGGSVLCLFVSTRKSLLFSGASDSILKVWDTDSLQELYTIYSVFDIGDIFAVLYSEVFDTVFFGSQNASIQWCNMTTIDRHTSLDRSGLPSNRFSKFFNSSGPGGKSSPVPKHTKLAVGKTLIELPYHNVVPYAHFGYVYCMQIYQPPVHTPLAVAEEYILSGGGDGNVNVWAMRNGTLVQVRKLSNSTSVLCMTVMDTFLYCGLTDGVINIWDLDAFQLIKAMQAHKEDVLSIASYGNCVFSGSATGNVRKWSRDLTLGSRWQCHDGLILSTITVRRANRNLLITGGNDDSIALWDIRDTFPCFRPDLSFENDQLLASLATFVSFRTVSGSEEYLADCRRCATFLKSLLKKFGAVSHLIVTENNRNPIVYGRFSANASDKTDTTVLFYGHYDVIDSSGSGKWETDPHSMAGLNGYLYGRGVSDNKGPVLAAVFAAAELFQVGKLRTNVVFLIEGEEECGSLGFQASVTAKKDHIGPDIDWILLSNSYWLDDEVPCLNYGLRGVIHLTVEINSDRPDLHSGVDGGIDREPLMDLTKLLAKLTDDSGRVLVPGFYEPVRPITEAEERLYEQIGENSSIGLSKELLMAKWRLPSLTVHAIVVSGPPNQTIIPHKATATISLRIVPDQDNDVVSATLQQYLDSQFASFKSRNHLSVKLNRQADAWLGDPENAAFKTLANAVKEEWGSDPLYIREGGTIPAVRFLEKAFDAPAAQLPCGQASDHAHLDNERLRVVNLYKAKNIWRRAFDELPSRAKKVNGVET
ncbi:hypothetical protein V1517DRAFT_328863 [Lipomyces orientalis]|uniref:Uncharacterized protein n=1 Tax=Lipomyces orientalis TaxID=1233043 RepID=A0ACC3THJ0_9ASCO